MVTIRGVSSLLGTPNPLYVIDGVVVGKGADTASLMAVSYTHLDVYKRQEWGGNVQSQEVSAKFGNNMDQLLDKVLLQAEMLELKANPNKHAQGVVIEASLDKGRGYVTTMLVQSGTLNVGDYVLAGKNHGKVKALSLIHI